MSIKIAKTEYVPLPADVYEAEVLTIEQTEGEYGDQLKFTFGLLDEEVNKRTLFGWCSAKYSPKSKLTAWTRAILGGEREGGFDSDLLLGQRCRLTVGLRHGSDGLEHNTITDILPSKAGAPSSAPRCTQPDDPYPDEMPEELEEIPF